MTPTEIKYTLEMVGIQLSKFTINRHLHECKCLQQKTNHYQQTWKAKLDFSRKYLIKASHTLQSDSLDRLNQDKLETE